MNYTDYFRSLRTQGRSRNQALAEMRCAGASVFDCIKAIDEAEAVGLGTAKRLVCESPAWSDVLEKTVSDLVTELERRDQQLLAVLRIAHDTSTRGAGLSARDALARTRYREIRQEFQEADLLPYLRTDPLLVGQWLSYSEDKRTDGGWYILRDGTVGRVHRPAESIRFSSLEEAVAAYVVRELDFWASMAPANTRLHLTAADDT